MLRDIINSHSKNDIALIVDENNYFTWGQITSFLHKLERNLTFIDEDTIVEIGAAPTLENILAVSSALFSGWSFETVDTVTCLNVQSKLESIILENLYSLQDDKGMENSLYDKEKQLVVLETSGTTGARKKILHSVFSIEFQAKHVCDRLKISPRDRQLAYMPLNYIYGLSILSTWLHSGSSLAISRFGVNSMANFFNELLDMKVTLFSGVPYTYLLMRKWGFERLIQSKIKTLTQAGGFLPKKIKTQICSELPDVAFIVMYGQTEFCGRISQGVYEDIHDELYVGTNLNEVKSIINDDGELYVHSPSVCLNADAIMKYKDHDGLRYYSTGDLAEIKDNNLIIYGRNNQFIKIGGKRFAQKDVVSLIEQNKLVDSVFLTVATDRSEKFLIGIHIGSNIPENKIESLEEIESTFKVPLKELLGSLSYHLCLVTGALPTLKSGKVDSLKITQAMREAYFDKKSIHIRL